MIIPDKCSSTKSDKIIALKERRSSFHFLNPERKKVKCVKVDGCAIIEGDKCDYLLIDSNNVEHFVELKGPDLKHALAQLEASIRQLGKNTPRYAFIVSTRCPLTGTDIQNAKKNFKNNFETTLIMKNLFCEHSHS